MIEQAVYQIIQNASHDERLWAIETIAQSLKQANAKEITPKSNTQELPLSREEIAKKRLGFFKGAMTMSDDFGDDLGDEFWLGTNA